MSGATMPSAPSMLSALPGLVWPALPSADGAAVLALLFHFEQSQWQPAAQLLDRQMPQLDVLLRHPHATVLHQYRALGEDRDRRASDSLDLLPRRRQICGGELDGPRRERRYRQTRRPGSVDAESGCSNLRADVWTPVLIGICDWFTEGFDTHDLKCARTLLDELR